jgi:hypothetical protein
MPDYIPILNSQVQPEAPADSSLFTRLRDNPLAQIAGEPGAPRTNNLSLAGDGFLSALEGSTSTVWVDQLDLARMKMVNLKFQGNKTGSGATNFEIAFSDTNGATWGANIVLLTLPALSGGDIANFTLDANLDLDTGTNRGFRVSYTVIGGTATYTQELLNTTLTMPSGGANALRLRNNGSGSWSAQIRVLGGRV